MLLWFILAAIALVFVAIDIRTTPESPVMKWGFVLVTAYTGVIDAFLYVLGCSEPLPGMHEQYVAAHWRQALGSTMHCVPGDGVGILAGAVLARALGLTGLPEIALEYVLGFAFGWTVFQALFMRDMVGGSYTRSLTSTFLPELLSMNLLMTGMVATMMILRTQLGRGADPTTAAFWFVMSMALLVGSIIAYPINWWLVRYHLKHGMMTVRPANAPPVAATPAHGGHASHADTARTPAAETMRMGPEVKPRPAIPVMTLLSFLALAAGLLVTSITASL
ncbi:MAG TPA: DUF4396 domain-containing protein [Stellaceae bacterium]|jgi:hypothetical protein